MKAFILFAFVVLTSCSVNRSLVKDYHLMNSKWKISYDLDEQTSREFQFKLKPNGQLEWKHPESKELANQCYWQVDLDTLILTTNSNYATFKGLFVSPDSLRGKANNQLSASWEWTAFRMKN